MRTYLANVGANSSHRQLFSPLFEDGTFEFLPIPEGDRNLGNSPHAVRYRELRSYYNPDHDLLRYVPQDIWDDACHNDPDFETFTYGDNGTNGRSSALTQLRKGDALLFLARLGHCTDGERTRHSGFYLIGGFIVDHAEFMTPHSQGRERFSNPESTERSGESAGTGHHRDGEETDLADMGRSGPVAGLLAVRGATHGGADGSKELSLADSCGASGRDL